MRLAKELAESLAVTIKSKISPLDYNGKNNIYLFGSRVDDFKKGGDIDLLLLTTVEIKNALKTQKHILLEELRQAAGDQRVDLTIKTHDEASTDPFVKSLKLIQIANF